MLNLGSIDFGEPDANAEFVTATKNSQTPLFLEAYLLPPINNLEKFISGDKFIILGQKGTGKTAILRYLENKAKLSGRKTDFLIFRNEILEEKELLDFQWPILIDDDKIKSTKHYLHCLKRVLITLLLKEVLKKEDENHIGNVREEDRGFLKGLFKDISESTPGQVVQIAFDSIFKTIETLNVDIEKVSHGGASASSRTLKRQNDSLIASFCKISRERKAKISLFVDEIHFAYKDEQTFTQDAMLVRDTIMAISNLNERFIKEGLDCLITVGVRSEFLEHPIISAAEINNTVDSFGEYLSWSTFPSNKHHPMFSIAARRVEFSLKDNFTANDLHRTYLANARASELVEGTWCKPRDIIRFFNVAKQMYPQKTTLQRNELNAVYREFANKSWAEVRTAATAFLPPQGISKLEEVLRDISPVFANKQNVKFDDFLLQIDPIYKTIGTNNRTAYSRLNLAQLLYILGIFSTITKDTKGNNIYHSYHRGNRFPSRPGNVQLHKIILKTFA